MVNGELLKRRNFMQQEASKKKKGKVEITHIRLSQQELNRVKCQQMLTDRHISAANQLLLSQFPDIRGLQSTFLGQSLSFRETEPPFIQILHVGGNHWMAVLAVDNSHVRVHDSMYDSMYRCISTCVLMQVASRQGLIICTSVLRTLQEGGVNCALFAIAYATEYCFGNNPECYRYIIYVSRVGR